MEGKANGNGQQKQIGCLDCALLLSRFLLRRVLSIRQSRTILATDFVPPHTVVITPVGPFPLHCAPVLCSVGAHMMVTGSSAQKKTSFFSH